MVEALKWLGAVVLAVGVVALGSWLLVCHFSYCPGGPPW